MSYGTKDSVSGCQILKEPQTCLPAGRGTKALSITKNLLCAAWCLSGFVVQTQQKNSKQAFLIIYKFTVLKNL